MTLFNRFYFNSLIKNKKFNYNHIFKIKILCVRVCVYSFQYKQTKINLDLIR